MKEKTAPEPTAFAAAVMDIAAERGVGDPANLKLRDDQHKALQGHMNGRRSREHLDLILCLGVARALGLDPDDPATSQDAQDLMRLSLAYTFGELAKSAR